MEKLNINDVKEFVNKNICVFHSNKLKVLKSLKLNDVLKKKNPYLFRAKNITIASDLISNILDAFLSSSEEKIFGDFLEKLAIFISGKTCQGRKSAATGIDVEFMNKKTLYLVSIKSGTNWGNSAAQNKQQQDFQTAVRVLKQTNHKLSVQPVLGICYGKTRTTFLRGYMKVVGQNFWYLISENKNLYTDIVEPLGYRAKQHNDTFVKQKGKVVNSFTQEFMSKFCCDGIIDWKKLVEFNSGNLDLNRNN
ncbi:MAG: PmeII family type II restriction endonuclease [Phycisphaerae bacterium]|jgi:hypothetical protein